MPTLGELLLAYVEQAYGQALTALAGKAQANRDNLLHLCLDPHADVEGYREIPDFLRKFMTEPLELASCYPTAEKLFPLIADATLNGGQGGSAPKVSFTTAVEVRGAMESLVTAMQQGITGNRDMVYRVELAGHGFTLVVRRPDADSPHQVELVETIADDAILTPSLRKPALAPAAVYAALRHLVDDAMPTRKQGATEMGWKSATDFWLAEQTGNDPVFPNIGMRWWSGALRHDAVQRWGALVASRLPVLDGAVLAQNV